MRNTLVLVSLCIGVVAGYITSTGQPEESETGVTLSETIVGTLNGKMNSINAILDSAPLTEKITTLRNTLDDVQDEALYEHGQDKQNNVNERSFLFLNQKYKKPARIQLHLTGSNCDIFDESLKEEGVEQLGDIPFKFSNNYFEDTYKQYPKQAKIEKSKNAYYAQPTICSLDDKGDKNVAKKVSLSDKQRDFMQLLKIPVIRSGKNSNQYKEKQILASKAHPINKDGPKQYYIVPKILSENRVGGMVKNHGYTRPYLFHRPVFNKELESADSNFLIDDDDQRVLSNSNSGEDKLLDRFLKATLTEQEHRERTKGNPTDCKYNECDLKTTKRVPHSHGLGHEADCKCGRWLHLKSSIIKDRKQRGQIKQSETTIEPISVEINNFEDILKAEPHKRKSEKEIKMSLRKFKNALYE